MRRIGVLLVLFASWLIWFFWRRENRRLAEQHASGDPPR